MLDLTTLIEWFQSYGYLSVFTVLLLCGFGLPIPEDISLVAGGVISGLGSTDVRIMVVVGMVGVLVGDLTMFTLGRVFGEKVLKFRLIARLITPQRYDQVQQKFQKYGQFVIFVARFMPGLRSPIFVVAGITRQVTYFKFILIDGFAALISVPVWIYLGYYGADNLDDLMEAIHRGQVAVLIGIVTFVGAIVAFKVWRYRRSRQEQAKQQAQKSSAETPVDGVVNGRTSAQGRGP